jgi:hypothetical protein
MVGVAGVFAPFVSTGMLTVGRKHVGGDISTLERSRKGDDLPAASQAGHHFSLASEGLHLLGIFLDSKLCSETLPQRSDTKKLIPLFYDNIHSSFQDISSYFGTPSFITVFTTVHHLSLS